MDEMKHSVMNIGTLGHIDHGKTSLTRAMTGIWTDRHSESIKRNMTIELGYADALIRKCKSDGTYTSMEKCPTCGSATEQVMRISLLDAPGHETLMATAIAGSSVIDAILFVIAANEPCPMQQTKEHLMIINILGIKNVIIVQTKVDIVGREAAIAHQKQIREFIKGSVIQDAPIVPVMPNMGINLDIVFKMITEMTRPERDVSADPLMYVVRSFDINKPGADLESIKGGVAGGSLIRGTLKVGDRIEISPGIKVTKSKKEVYAPIVTVVKSLSNGTDPIDVATPGGLVGISTEIDPCFAKADGLVGNVVGHAGKTPKATTFVTVKYHKLDRDDIPVQHVSDKETMILGIGTATVLGYIKRAKKDTIEFELKRPVCIDKGMKIAVMRNIAKRWRLTGYGTPA